MKLYYSPAACSLAAHITLHELGLPFSAIKVDLKKKLTASGADFQAINPKGYVPALQLEGGDVLTEGPAVLQYLADRKPEAGLAPAAGSLARYRLQEWLGFINSEIHKTFSPLFSAETPAAERLAVTEKLGKRFAIVEGALKVQPFLLGEQFTVADAYLYTVIGWSKYVGVNLAPWPALQAHQARVAQRPSVQAAQQTEQAA